MPELFTKHICKIMKHWDIQSQKEFGSRTSLNKLRPW